MTFKCICAAAACCMGLARGAAAQPAAAPANDSSSTPARQRVEPAVPGPTASEQSGIGAFLASINSDADGWTPRVGSVTSGGGLALGGHYRAAIGSGKLHLDTEYLASIKGYQSALFDLSSRPLLNGRMTVGGGLRYTSLPQEDFFGFGADSSLTSHASYERQGLDARGWVSFRPTAGVEIRSTVGLLDTKIFSGEQAGVPGIEDVRFAAGFDAPRQGGRFLHAGVEATIDRRDNPRNPQSGTFLRASLDRYSCFTLGENGVIRFDVDGRGYLPIRGLSGHDSLALRGAVSLTNAHDRQAAFYLLPRLGGSGTLRGFETSRFVDAQAAFFSAEYRWQLQRKLQIVGFVDAGTVASSISQFSGARLHTAVGTGVRYRGFRFDYAVSREGNRFHVGFGPSF